ncbi:MAG: hypothetical protein E7527_01290 [Ruminococcaceae bacterium]|nr:hypothetical protein [Oscillospiraceae bacterium]
MKKICAIFMTGLLCCGLLCGCGDEPVEIAGDNGTKAYEQLTEPAVDLLITDCITEEQISTVLGYPVHQLPQVGDNTEALYQSEDGTYMVKINLKNESRGLFDTTIAGMGDSVTLYEGVGEVAYWSSDNELIVYQNGYVLGVWMTIPGVDNAETQTRQIAELMLGTLQPVAQ